MLSWLEERLHCKKMLTQPSIQRGWSMWYYFPGCFLSLVFVWQVITGFGLTPLWQGTTAHLAVSSWLQQFHIWGAHFTMGCAVVYFFLRVLTHAYQKPRELQWLLNIVIGGLLGGSFITGTLLVSPEWQRLFPATRSEYLLVMHVSIMPLLVVAAWAVYLILETRQSKLS